MDRKRMLVLVAVAGLGVAMLFIMRDPVQAADTVQRGGQLFNGAITMVANSLSTFFQRVLG